MINDYEKEFLSFTSIVDRDDNGKAYNKSFYYMDESVRISIKTLTRLLACSKSAQLVYFTILNQLNKNEYEVTISRNILKSSTNLSDASVSRAIEELTRIPNDNLGDKYPLIQVVDKDTYHVPINQCVKGNVNTIIQKEEELKKQLAMIEKEKENREKITELTLKLRSKKK